MMKIQLVKLQSYPKEVLKVAAKRTGDKMNPEVRATSRGGTGFLCSVCAVKAKHLKIANNILCFFGNVNRMIQCEHPFPEYLTTRAHP